MRLRSLPIPFPEQCMGQIAVRYRIFGGNGKGMFKQSAAALPMLELLSG